MRCSCVCKIGRRKGLPALPSSRNCKIKHSGMKCENWPGSPEKLIPHSRYMLGFVWNFSDHSLVLYERPHTILCLPFLAGFHPKSAVWDEQWDCIKSLLSKPLYNIWHIYQRQKYNLKWWRTVIKTDILAGELLCFSPWSNVLHWAIPAHSDEFLWCSWSCRYVSACDTSWSRPCCHPILPRRKLSSQE